MRGAAAALSVVVAVAPVVEAAVVLVVGVLLLVPDVLVGAVLVDEHNDSFLAPAVIGTGRKKRSLPNNVVLVVVAVEVPAVRAFTDTSQTACVVPARLHVST